MLSSSNVSIPLFFFFATPECCNAENKCNEYDEQAVNHLKKMASIIS